MRKFIRVLTLTVVPSFLFGCATTSEQFLPAPDLDSPIGEGKAIIKLHREPFFAGSGYKWPMYDNETFIGKIANDGYLIWERGANKIMCITPEKSMFENVIESTSLTLLIEKAYQKPDCVRVEEGKINEFEFLFSSKDGRRLFKKEH